MGLVTLEMGPTWKMQILLGVLEEHGVPGFVADSNLKVIDPFITGTLSFDARLQVPEESVEAARAALEEARADGLEQDLAAEAERAFDEESGGDGPEAGVKSAEREEELARSEATPEPEVRDAELEAMAELGRRIRWGALFFWMHPLVFGHGATYLRWIVRAGRAPAGNGVTLFALGAVSAFWLLLLTALVWAAVSI